MPADIEAIAEQVFTVLTDPTRRAILAALPSGGPATATDLSGRLPITRQGIAKHLALLADGGLVAAEPGERRRVRYRLRSASMQVARQFLAALARDWDGCGWTRAPGSVSCPACWGGLEDSEDGQAHAEELLAMAARERRRPA